VSYPDVISCGRWEPGTRAPVYPYAVQSIGISEQSLCPGIGDRRKTA